MIRQFEPGFQRILKFASPGRLFHRNSGPNAMRAIISRDIILASNETERIQESRD